MHIYCTDHKWHIHAVESLYLIYPTQVLKQAAAIKLRNSLPTQKLYKTPSKP